MQLLWINVITNGLPALALALDRNPGVMEHRPRPANSALLDAASLGFIFKAGAIAALAGVALLVALPQFGYSPGQARTAVFMFEGLVGLAFVYSARRVTVVPLSNVALHAAVVLGGGLQMATVWVPGLRDLLGLESIDARVWMAIAGAVLACWAASAVISRRSFAQQARRTADIAAEVPAR